MKKGPLSGIFYVFMLEIQLVQQYGGKGRIVFNE